MRLRIFLIIVITIVCANADCFSQNEKQVADSLYFLPNPTQIDDQQAIQNYRLFLDKKEINVIPEDYIQAAERLGNLLSTYGNTDEAIQVYRQGIAKERASEVSDTLLYATHLYLGEALFAVSRLDSSVFHLQEAEKLQKQIVSGKQPERLYNALGVYFYETGNYLQSLSYFRQAENEVLGIGGDYEKYALYSFLSNQASALNHLDQFDSAQVIYLELLDWGINKNEILLNLANTHLEKIQANEALAVLGKLESPDSLQLISLLNLQAKAFLLKGEKVLAQETLQELEPILLSEKMTRNSLQKGIFWESRGKLAKQKGDSKAAVAHFHQAVVQLHPDFEEMDFWCTPRQNSLGMGAVSLFELLVQKGQTAWEIYSSEGEEKWFTLGLDSYAAAFGLSNYIRLNFDTDESRIFLGDQVLMAYQDAMDQLIEIQKKSEDPELIKLAFEWAEESKAGALRLGGRLERIKKQSGIPANLLEEERRL